MNMIFKSSAIDQNGTVGYIGYLKNGVNKIGKYDLRRGDISLVNNFDNNGKIINPDKLCITDNYLISYSSNFLSVDYFNLSSLSWVGRFYL